MREFPFRYEELKAQYRKACDLGYRFITCREYASLKRSGGATRAHKTIVNRVDIDFSVKKAEPLLDLYHELGIHGSFFVRLHAVEYNPFSFENFRILKKLLANGNELGYHAEAVDQAAIWDEDPADCVRRDLKVMRDMFETEIVGAASHNGLTGLNNLDFWTGRNPQDFGLLYEAYDKTENFNLFHESFYISDSEWNRWKCYDRGELRQGDRRSFGEHLDDGHNLIYLLTHSDTYYNRHFYENER